ncbi:MAG: hypothetical protein HY791_21855 [Deltaproteobacteria bacterium]|nr:hypothetical protein [Deltaproteobacteria bacterium]
MLSWTMAKKDGGASGGSNGEARLDRVERKVDDTRELVHALTAGIAQFVTEQRQSNLRMERFIEEQRQTNAEQRQFNAEQRQFNAEQRQFNVEQHQINAELRRDNDRADRRFELIERRADQTQKRSDALLRELQRDRQRIQNLESGRRQRKAR